MPRNPTAASFREVVEKRVEMAGRTDAERAAALGISRQTLDAWRKNGNLRITQLAKLAEASGHPLVLYFDPDTKKEPDPIEWDRLSGWLSSIQAMVDATRPGDPVTDVSMIAEVESELERGGGSRSQPPAAQRPKADRRPGDGKADKEQ